MTSHIETLVQQLHGEAAASYDARAELIWIGADAIPAVIDGLPSLGGFGQLTAIEVFELDSDNPTVRDGRPWPWRAWRSTAPSSPCATPIAPAWNGRPLRTGPSLSASAGP
ncbi:hypothetical protein [Streptomyces sp. AM 2-1-1]|uniref:hypothetical protein n=1 Tax=unclassified Streptomyces TaxID=2593676 RepID=UPI0023B9B5BD|nr:hypothetical protein [Streptomyces sp. AM 2-1-1]WEH39899.1 hypothetical protein PZB77_10415 [Streptomyces sp. AM 2-1-1]